MNKYELIQWIKESTLVCDEVTDQQIADALCDGEYLDKLSRGISFDQETVEDAYDYLTTKKEMTNEKNRS